MTTQKFTNLYEDSPYLTAFDLANQGDVELTIERIDSDPAGVEVLGRRIKKPVVYFKGAKKGWVCPKTKMLQLLLKYGQGAKTPADLVGKKIKLRCNMNGKNPAYPGGKGPAVEVA